MYTDCGRVSRHVNSADLDDPGSRKILRIKENLNKNIIIISAEKHSNVETNITTSK